MIAIELSDTERHVLASGVLEWGGPASCTDELAVAMGFASKADLFSESRRLIDAIRNDESLGLWDWARVLVL